MLCILSTLLFNTILWGDNPKSSRLTILENQGSIADVELLKYTSPY
ncbi:hypothetical protein CRENPOLYSF2_560027 [Crenothrix polyspora]|uniref:Uncharacterized protein n=1 Tax=Crenothrix polyspora TaxID=360316 RepID=A0A1R4HHV1_9GAMM|nr:hypothetical protein CRENPOLYSF2_560027 [Crenothrix polyspora]